MKFIFIATIIFLFSFGIRERTHYPIFDEYLGSKIELVGVVVEEPEEKSFYQQVIVEVSGAPKKQKIIVQAPFYPNFDYGDEVKVKGKLKSPEDFKTDTGRVFPYKKFLAKDNIFYILSSADVEIIDESKGNPIKHILFKIKNSFIDQIEKIIPRPESALLSGMLIAGKGGLGKTLEEKFKDVGLIHIVVLSGYNVTVVAQAFISTFKFLPRYFGHSLGVIGIILFGIMAGGGATIIRASFMAIVAIFAKITGETYSALKALFVGGAIMAIINPLTPLYDPSFHLSFMATFALIVFSGSIQKILGTFGKSYLGEIISSTLAVEIFLLPYLLWSNGYFAPISFIANIFVIPYIPFTMLAGFVAVVTSYISVFFAKPFAAISFIMLRYVMRIVEIAGNFTWFRFSI